MYKRQGDILAAWCSSLPKDKAPPGTGGALRDKSLTMTYFHRRPSTIIGAKAFHCPVRDGKEWYHLAMVVKRNCLSGCLKLQPLESWRTSWVLPGTATDLGSALAHCSASCLGLAWVLLGSCRDTAADPALRICRQTTPSTAQGFSLYKDKTPQDHLWGFAE